MTKQQIIDYFIESNAEHNETFRNYENMNLAWKQHIEDLYMSDAIKQLQRDSLEENFSKKDFEKINQQIKEKIEASKIHENSSKKNAENMALDISSEGKKIVPFEIINNESTGQINIKFNFSLQNPLLTDIIKELKENGWNYASSSRQWYPIKIENSVAFANELQKKI